jgi:hypothetical protein
VRTVKPPPCPECWAPMQLCMTLCAWECTAPHGSAGEVLIGCDGYRFPPRGRHAERRADGSEYWVDDRGLEHDLPHYPEATY